MSQSIAEQYTEEQLIAALEIKRAMKEKQKQEALEEYVKRQVLELLNQAMIQLKDVPLPEIDEDYDPYGSNDGTFVPVAFKDRNELSAVKTVIDALIEGLEAESPWHSSAQKLARSYYSSFCNA